MIEHKLLKAIVERSNGFGCTTFSLKKENRVVFGRNFDFMIGYGHIIVNKRNVTKSTLVESSEKQFNWTSKFGSITFNQVGREFPYGGMNESGLVIEQLWLNSTTYPLPDHRFEISVLQWIQYQIDTAESIDDIISSDAKLRITNDSGAALHFFVTDKNGDAACIDFINGKMTVARNHNLKVKAVTNNSYAESIASLTSTKKEEVRQNIFTNNSLDRFKKTAQMLKEFTPVATPMLVDYSFEILEAVKQEDYTQWSIVYDITNSSIHFKTKRNRDIQIIKLEDFDFSSATDCMVSDMQQVNFRSFSTSNNLKLINKVFDSLDMLRGIPKEIREITSKYPNTTVFNDKKK